MTIHLAPPLSFWCYGQRPNNEDHLWPMGQPVSPDTRLFLVCDGMGGWDKGEQASRILTESIAAYVRQHPTDIPDESYLAKAVQTAQHRMLDYLYQNPLVSRMGSTLAMLYFHEHGATIAHIGDSRVYHIRNGQILFRTEDHKQVLDMVRDGIITEEQASTHPWRNRLSRSVGVQAPDGDSAHHKSDRADIEHITDIQPGDYFFLCSDGVLEQVTDERLVECLRADISDEVKKAQLIAWCADKTKDNYTGFLVRVSAVTPTKQEALQHSIGDQVALTENDILPSSLTETDPLPLALPPGKRTFFQRISDRLRLTIMFH